MTVYQAEEATKASDRWPWRCPGRGSERGESRTGEGLRGESPDQGEILGGRVQTSGEESRPVEGLSGESPDQEGRVQTRGGSEQGDSRPEGCLRGESPSQGGRVQTRREESRAVEGLREESADQRLTVQTRGASEGRESRPGGGSEGESPDQ